MALRLYFRPAITHQELEKENQELRQINETIQREIAALKLQLSQVYKLINGFKSERFSPEVLEHQLSLFAPQETTPKETASKENLHLYPGEAKTSRTSRLTGTLTSIRNHHRA